MKVVRVIKWIAFVVFVLAFALNLVANGFIVADVACVAKETSCDPVVSILRIAPNENDMRVSDVKTYLADLDYGMANLRAPLKSYAETAAADEKPAETPKPIETEAPVIANPVVTEAPEVTDDQGTGSSGSMAYAKYDVKDHSNLVFGIMKYGSASCEFKWLTGPLGFENVSISVSFFVAMVALLVSFIMHVICKRYKTVYGTILMIVGFIFMFGMLLLGVYGTEVVMSEFLKSLVTTDVALVQLCCVLTFGILGTLIGLPIYSCGCRQITCKRLRRRLRRRASR